MRKHIFETSNIFLYTKRALKSMLEYWSYATHKKTFFLYMYVCIFVTLCRKLSILNARLIFFIYKKTQKKNTFKWFCLPWLLFKWIKFHWSAGDPGSFSPPLSTNPCLFWMPRMTYELMDRASAFLPLVSKERLLSPFSVSVSSFSSGFLHLLLLCSADFICRKNGAKTESQSLLLPCFSSLFFVFSFLFYCLPSWSHCNARMKEETPSVLCGFFFPNCLPLLRFLSFFFLSFLSPLGQQPRLLYSLYMALFRKQILH